MVDLGSLSFRKERAILEGVRRHLGEVNQTVYAFCDAVGAAGLGDRVATSDQVQ
jgi:hypothetical protein